MIKLIVAHDLNKLIGVGDKMPWHIKEELAFFKKETLHHALLMGKKTFVGLGKNLPDRTIYVLTKDLHFKSNNANVVVIREAEPILKQFQKSKDLLFIAGGRSIYEQFYPYAQELIISTIKNEYRGNVYFIDIDYTQYQLIDKEDHGSFLVNRYQKK